MPIARTINLEGSINSYEIRFYKSKPFYANETISGQAVCNIKEAIQCKFLRCSVACVVISRLSLYSLEETLYRESKTLAHDYNLSEGKHKFEFNFTLPDHPLPPSFSALHKLVCHWVISLKLYEQDINEIPVSPVIIAQRKFHKGTLYYPNAGIVPKARISKKLKSLNVFGSSGRRLYLQASLEKDVYCRGEPIPVSIKLCNQTNRTIREVEVQVNQKFRFTVDESMFLTKFVTVDHAVVVPTNNDMVSQSPAPPRTISKTLSFYDSLKQRRKRKDSTVTDDENVASKAHHHKGRSRRWSLGGINYPEVPMAPVDQHNPTPQSDLLRRASSPGVSISDNPNLDNVGGGPVLRKKSGSKKARGSRTSKYGHSMSTDYFRSAAASTSQVPEHGEEEDETTASTGILPSTDSSSKLPSGIKYRLKAVVIPRVTHSKGYRPITVPSYLTDLKPDTFSEPDLLRAAELEANSRSINSNQPRTTYIGGSERLGIQGQIGFGRNKDEENNAVNNALQNQHAEDGNDQYGTHDDGNDIESCAGTSSSNSIENYQVTNKDANNTNTSNVDIDDVENSKNIANQNAQSQQMNHLASDSAENLDNHRPMVSQGGVFSIGRPLIKSHVTQVGIHADSGIFELGEGHDIPEEEGEPEEEHGVDEFETGGLILTQAEEENLMVTGSGNDSDLENDYPNEYGNNRNLSPSPFHITITNTTTNSNATSTIEPTIGGDGHSINSGLDTERNSLNSASPGVSEEESGGNMGCSQTNNGASGDISPELALTVPGEGATGMRRNESQGNLHHHSKNQWRELLKVIHSSNSGKDDNSENPEEGEGSSSESQPSAIYHPPSFTFEDDCGTILELQYMIKVTVKYLGGSISVSLPFSYSDLSENGELTADHWSSTVTIDKTYVTKTPSDAPPQFEELQRVSLDRQNSINLDDFIDDSQSVEGDLPPSYSGIFKEGTSNNT